MISVAVMIVPPVAITIADASEEPPRRLSARGIPGRQSARGYPRSLAVVVRLVMRAG